MGFEKDTIFAPGTPSGGAISVIRISGENAHSVLDAVFSRSAQSMPHAQLVHGSVKSGGHRIDDVMAVRFFAPRSYTGEDMAELHCHGGRVSMAGVLAALRETGARLAEPGEFTKRAFLNGKMDLSAAGAVMDLIEAHSSAEADAALRQLSGGLYDKISAVQQKLTDALAIIEAGIEYPEDDIEADIRRDAVPLIDAAMREISSVEDTFASGRMLSQGYTVAIAGRPNVGKSSLFNMLLGKDRAIVTGTPGTTRDSVDDTLILDGVLVRLVDTAGMRRGRGEAEQIGIERAKHAVKTADMTLFVIDGSQGVVNADVEAIKAISGEAVVVVNKSDLPHKVTPEQAEQTLLHKAVAACAISGQGREQILALIHPPHLHEAEDVVILNERHARILHDAKQSLAAAKEAFGMQDLNCVTVDIKEAWDHLGEITGVTVTQEIIDQIFSRFCLGK